MTNLFGDLLNKYRLKKQAAIRQARDELEKRNGVDYSNTQQFKLEEQEIRLPNSKEVIELRLWKLVDAAVIRMDSDVTNTTDTGITALGDFHSDPTHPLYIAPEAPDKKEEDWS